MYSVSRLITQAYKPYLDNLGLTYPQYLVMLVLWENDEVSVNHITQKLLLNTNTVSPLLKRMEKQGLVERRRSKEDERAVIVKLTKKGKSMHDAAAQIPHQLMEEVSSGDMSTEEVNNLKTTLCKWMDILSKR
jgi:DNA-binding MarR family transcriptional regulator